MAITFGGLATGMDTNGLIEQLMQVERLPLGRLETEKNYMNSRLTAFSGFEDKLDALQSAAEDIDTTNELLSFSSSLPSEDYISATADSTASEGNYLIEVVSLALQEKEVATGWADIDTTTDNGSATLSLTVDGVQTDIDTSGLTLAEISQAINDSGAEATASIINDGTATPYRLVITANNAGETITTAGDSDLVGTFTETQTGAQSHIKVDGIDVYGTSNTISDAIEGVTLDLNQNNAAAETTLLTIGVDKDAVKTKIETFVSKYNDIITYIDDQSDASWSSDQAFRSTKRRLQNLLVTSINGTGDLSYLTELGITTDQTSGTLSIDSSTLSDAIEDNLENVEKLLAGETGVEGIASQFASYLESITDSVDGLYAARKDTTEDSIRWLDNRIISMESRLEKKETVLRAQFSALEELVSAMNSQSAYLTQQMNAMSKMWS